MQTVQFLHYYISCFALFLLVEVETFSFCDVFVSKASMHRRAISRVRLFSSQTMSMENVEISRREVLAGSAILGVLATSSLSPQVMEASAGMLRLAKPGVLMNHDVCKPAEPKPGGYSLQKSPDASAVITQKAFLELRIIQEYSSQANPTSNKDHKAPPAPFPNHPQS